MTFILVFGTSIEYGAWDFEGGWVQRLRTWLDKKQLGKKDYPIKDYYELYNLGVSGDTSEGILGRIEQDIKSRTRFTEKGEKVIILISASFNDSMYNNKNKKHMISIEKTVSNVQKIIDVSKKYASDTIFVGSTPVDESKTTPLPWARHLSGRQQDIDLFDSKIAELCNKNNIQFIDLLSEFKKSNYKKLLKDGIHPNSEGHKIMFETVKRYLEVANLI